MQCAELLTWKGDAQQLCLSRSGLPRQDSAFEKGWQSFAELFTWCEITWLERLVTYLLLIPCKRFISISLDRRLLVFSWTVWFLPSENLDNLLWTLFIIQLKTMTKISKDW